MGARCGRGSARWIVVQSLREHWFNVSLAKDILLLLLFTGIESPFNVTQKNTRAHTDCARFRKQFFKLSKKIEIILQSSFHNEEELENYIATKKKKQQVQTKITNALLKISNGKSNKSNEIVQITHRYIYIQIQKANKCLNACKWGKCLFSRSVICNR